jgi:hypothetical protein
MPRLTASMRQHHDTPIWTANNVGNNRKPFVDPVYSFLTLHWLYPRLLPVASWYAERNQLSISPSTSAREQRSTSL